MPLRGMASPGHGKGEGPGGSELSRSDDDDDDGRGRSAAKRNGALEKASYRQAATERRPGWSEAESVGRERRGSFGGRAPAKRRGRSEQCERSSDRTELPARRQGAAKARKGRISAEA